jgi:hypothetical protein
MDTYNSVPDTTVTICNFEEIAALPDSGVVDHFHWYARQCRGRVFTRDVSVDAVRVSRTEDEILIHLLLRKVEQARFRFKALRFR